MTRRNAAIEDGGQLKVVLPAGRGATTAVKYDPAQLKLVETIPA